MDAATMTRIREGRVAVNALEAALSSPVPQEHQRAVQALSLAMEREAEPTRVFA